MAKKISLMIYGLSVMDEKNKRCKLNDMESKGSILDIFERYICENKEYLSQDKSKEMLFQFENVEKHEIKNRDGQIIYRVLYGRVKTGEYGIESELVNIHTDKITNRTPEQADMMPFGFCVAVPAGDVNSAIMIFQTMGIYGMKVALQKHLQKCLAEISPEFHLMLRTIAPKEYIDNYFSKGVLQKIRMIRYEIPEDISNRVGINYGVKQTKEERIIHKPLGFMERNKKKIDEWKLGQRSYSKIIELDGFEYDDLKLEFALGDTNKTFNLGDMESLVLTEDITKKIKQEGGHPTFESLKDVMGEKAKEYLCGMGFVME